MMHWKSDEELFALIRSELTSCPISDVMEQMGLLSPMLPPQIGLLQPGLVMVGRAMPVQDEPPLAHGVPARFDSQPFGLLFESVEALRPGEVYLVSGGMIDAARMGELLVRRARKLGAAGVVVNAHTRDGDIIRTYDIPVFSHGNYAYGLQRRHNVVDYRCSIKIGDVRVKPGDLVFGDGDGVCVIPREAETEVIARAIAKAETERKIKNDIENGFGVVEAFRKYQVM